MENRTKFIFELLHTFFTSDMIDALMKKNDADAFYNAIDELYADFTKKTDFGAIYASDTEYTFEKYFYQNGEYIKKVLNEYLELDGKRQDDRFILVKVLKDDSIKAYIGTFNDICNEIEKGGYANIKRSIVFDRQDSDGDLNLNCYEYVGDNILYSQFIDAYYDN